MLVPCSCQRPLDRLLLRRLHRLATHMLRCLQCLVAFCYQSLLHRVVPMPRHLPGTLIRKCEIVTIINDMCAALPPRIHMQVLTHRWRKCMERGCLPDKTPSFLMNCCFQLRDPYFGVVNEAVVRAWLLRWLRAQGFNP